MMINLPPHFTLDELTHSQEAVRLGIDNTPTPEIVRNLEQLARVLEGVRLALNAQPIHISSGYRSWALNARIGGSSASQHLRGLAVDFTCPAYGSPLTICRRLLDIGFNFDQMIFEGTWVHLSIAEPGVDRRGQVLTAVFAPGKKTRYLAGLVA